ncbi:tetratricopeptide repeat protein [bacterium]|nr:tetratricopeptide repeat protein [bacterium]
MKITYQCALVLILFWIIVPQSPAAITAKMHALVVDDQGNPVDGAKLTLVFSRGGQGRTFETNTKGKIFSPFIDVGEYNLTVEKEGYYLSQFSIKIKNANAEIEMDETRNLGPKDSIPEVRFQADRVLYFHFLLSHQVIQSEQEELDEFTAPRKLRAFLEEVKNLYQLEKYDDMLHELDDKMKKFPDEPALHYLKGLVLYKKDDLDGATGSFSRSLELDPNQIDANFYLGEIAQKRGNTSLAIEYFSKELQLNAENTAILAALTLLYKETKNYEQAIANCQKFLSIKPNETIMKLELADLYQATGQADKAKEILATLEQQGVLDASAFYNQGVAEWNAQNYNLALNAFQRAIMIDPNLVLAYKQIGFCYIKLNEPTEAITFLNKYLEMAPDAGDKNETETIITKLKKALK